MGTARWKGDAGNWGDSFGMRVAASTQLSGRRCRRESDRVIILVKPGNAGGGKGPDFWCAFEVGEEGVIGDEPRNTRKDQEPAEEAVS